MTFNIKSNSWLKCLRSGYWNQRSTLCIMGVIGYTCIGANNAIFYSAFDYITSIEAGKVVPTEFAWTSLERSLAKASYFLGFSSSSIPGIFLAGLMREKSVFGIGCTCSGLGAILTPILMKHGGKAGIIVLRIFVGAAEAMTIPSGLNLLSKWSPLEERGQLVGVFLTAPQLGLTIGYISGGFMIDKIDEFVCFHIWGGTCLVFCVLFYFLCYSEPRTNPFISRNEFQFLDENIPNVSEHNISFVLRRCMKSTRVWCAIVSTFGFYWCFYSIVIDLPGYMQRILRFNVVEAGAMMSVPFTLTYAISLSSCYMADFVLKKKVLRRWTMRKLCVGISSVPPAFSILGAYHIGSKQRALTVCLFALTLIFMSFYYCGLQVNTTKLSPRNLSLFLSVINTFGGIAAFLAPIVHGYVTAGNEESKWCIVGWISFAFLLSGIVLHLFCFSAERHWWTTQVIVDDFDRRNNVRIRLGDLNTRKKELATQRVDKEEELKQMRKGYNGEDGNVGNNVKGILKKEAEKADTHEPIGMDAVSSKFNGEDNELMKRKGILKKQTDEAETKEQEVGLDVSEEDEAGTTIKGISKEYLSEEAKTKERTDMSSNSKEADERTKIKGILKKEQKEESEDDEKRVTIVEPVNNGKDEGQENRDDVER